MTERALTDADFIAQWNQLERRERLHLRRLARMGRAADDSTGAKLILEYARFQRSRIWMRFFWVWFVPGVIIALGVAVQMHPLVVGVVLAFAAQAAFAWVNLRRAEKVNATHLR